MISFSPGSPSPSSILVNVFVASTRLSIESEVNVASSTVFPSSSIPSSEISVTSFELPGELAVASIEL